MADVKALLLCFQFTTDEVYECSTFLYLLCLYMTKRD